MANTCFQAFMICVFFSVSFTKHTNCDSIYEIPDPKIEVFSKGFRVSIPDEEGIDLFSFHGNLNIPLNNLEAGQFSEEVLKQKNGRWVFHNRRAKLNVGDVIYYWIFVIRVNLGYRLENKKFVVNEIKPFKVYDDEVSSEDANNSSWDFDSANKLSGTTHKDQATSPVPLLPTSNTRLPPVLTEYKPTSTCCQLLLNETKEIALLSEQIDKLTEENNILSEIAQKDEHYATTLRIFGKYSNANYPTPKEFIQNLIIERLKLLDVIVLEAKKIPDNGISFQVKALKDKVKVIRAARVRLDGSKYELSW